MRIIFSAVPRPRVTSCHCHLDQSEDHGEDQGEDQSVRTRVRIGVRMRVRDQSGGRDPASLSDSDPAVMCPSVVTKSLRQRRSACSE